MKLSVHSLVFICLTTFISAGCSDSVMDATPASAAMTFVNTVCPIMGGKVDKEDPTLVREWNGKKVGFCCPPCLEEWDELTDAEKSDKLANPTGDDDTSTHDHADHNHADEKDSSAK